MPTIKQTLNELSDRASCLASIAIASSTIRDGGALDAGQRIDVADELLNAIRYLAEALAQDASALAGNQ